jgi:hypothetical protein
VIFFAKYQLKNFVIFDVKYMFLMACFVYFYQTRRIAMPNEQKNSNENIFSGCKIILDIDGCDFSEISYQIGKGKTCILNFYPTNNKVCLSYRKDKGLFEEVGKGIEMIRFNFL